MSRRLMLIVVGLLTTLFSWNALAETHRILFLSSAHNNKAQVSLLKQMAEDRGMLIEHEKEKSIGDLAKAQALFQQYDLVIFGGVSGKHLRVTIESDPDTLEQPTVKEFVVALNRIPTKQAITCTY